MRCMPPKSGHKRRPSGEDCRNTIQQTTMTTTIKKDGGSNAKKKLQAMFAQDIVDACANDRLCPWHTPAFGKTAIQARSCEGYKYKGVNNVFLTLRMLQYGWTHPVFGTSRSWKRVGVTPNESYKTSPIFFYKLMQKMDENGNPIPDENGNAIEYPILKYSRVINVEQTNADLSKYVSGGRYEIVNESEAFNVILNLVDLYSRRTGVSLVLKDTLQQGVYDFADDTITVSSPTEYPSMHAFGEDMLRLLAMSTANSSKGVRAKGANLPTDEHKKVILDLTAEMAASIIMYRLGIAYTKQDNAEMWAAYCKEWAGKISEYPDAVWKASCNAVSVAECILGVQAA